MWQAARALNYEPNRVARNLRARTTRTIGVVIPNIENPFFTSVVRGIENVLQASEYGLLLGNANEDPERERFYLAMLRAEGVAGIIFVPLAASPRAYQPLLDAGLSLVAVDRVPVGLNIDLVTVANTPGARAAVTHLLGLGRRRIGLITGPASYSTAQERRAGYEQAITGAGLAVQPELIYQGDYREAGGCQGMQALLALPEPPQAVFVANNMMTLGALQAIHERNLRIPSEMAIVSFDDMSWANALQPPLTAVAQPPYEVGATAAEMMLQRLREPVRPVRHVTLETRLIVRASCGART